ARPRRSGAVRSLRFDEAEARGRLRGQGGHARRAALRRVPQPRRDEKGRRRFLVDPEGEGFAIDRAKVEEDQKFDGVFVLRTNAHLSPLEAMLVYKQLWTVERTFRTTKSLLETRPIYHKLDETIRGHVACSFLALVLKKE